MVQMKHADRDCSVHNRNFKERSSPLLPGFLSVLLIPLITGILAGEAFSIPFSVFLYLLPVGALVLLGCYLAEYRSLFFIVAAGCCFLAGAFLLTMQKQPSERHVRALPAPLYLDVSGHVEAVRTRTQDLPGSGERPWSTARLRVHRMKVGEEWVQARGTIMLYTFMFLPSYRPGDSIRISGRLKRFSSGKNPGAHPLTWWRNQHGVGGNLVVTSSADWSRRPSASRCWSANLSSARQWIYDRIRETDFTLDLLPALLLGFRSSIPDAEEQWFQTSGVIHFLAVSGLHVGFVIAFFFFLFRVFGVSLEYSSVGILVVLGFYVALTGFRIATIRAALMAGVFFLGLLLRKPINVFQTLVISAWMILVFRPYDLFSPGFHFSFGSVLILFLFFGQGSQADPVQNVSNRRDGNDPDGAGGVGDGKKAQEFRERLAAIPRSDSWMEQIRRHSITRGLISWMKTAGNRAYQYLKLMTSVTLVILLGILPLSAYHFNLASLGAFLLNPPFFLVIPVFLVLGFLFTVFSILHHLVPLGLWYYVVQVLGGLLQHLEGVLSGSARLLRETGAVHLYLPAPSVYVLGGYWVILLVFIFVLRRRTVSSGLRYVLYVGMGILCLFVTGAGWFSGRLYPGAQRSVTLLDVGHGLSTVLRDRSGATVVYDAGARGFSDPGEHVIAPALWHQGTRSIDVLIVSHGDLDHISGIRSLANRFSIGAVWVSPYLEQTEAGRAILQPFRANGTPVRVVQEGDRGQAGDIELTVLSPAAGQFEEGRPESRNAASLVVQAKMGGKTVLLTGDLEERGKQAFRRKFSRKSQEGRRHREDEQSQNHAGLDRSPAVLQVPHHGGSGSAENPLSSLITPKHAMISAGQGTVSEEIRKAYRSGGAQLYMTGNTGAVQLRWEKGSEGIREFRWDRGWKQIGDP